MTIVEFYDKTSIENLAGAILCKPERIILVGNDDKQMIRRRDYYQSILDKNGIPTQVLNRYANNQSIPEIVEVLSKIVEEYDDCQFDLTGGDELYLVAVGIVMKSYEGKVQCHRFNLRSKTISDCDSDGKVCSPDSFNVSVEENINIYGGKIVTDPEEEAYTYPWEFNDEFVRDVDAMWRICKKDTRLWNAHVGTLGTICKRFKSEDPLYVSFNKAAAVAYMKKQGLKYVCIAGIMYELQRCGLIGSLKMQDTISFVFKNDQIKQCLTIAGQVLELVVACMLKSLKEKDGTDMYNDVRVGVVIDWDAIPQQKDKCKTINEIDVIAMKGAIPIFISCKNGILNANELYKLNTVAERFGSKYARKVLIAAELDKAENSTSIRERSKDIGIKYIENIDEMEEAEFARQLRLLVSV